ncbi:MAG: response regulator [Syntrophorhabdales bacterium]|jgi:CheY-like chemotaxis protein
MRKTIVVADRDERLQQAFTTIFSREHYDIMYASSGKEVEKIADRMSPDIYIVNVNLPKTNGIEVYKKLQKRGNLERASFYFLKDETDTTELLGYQADGVIEKPINFFRVYETITSEDEIIELTDLVDEGDGPVGAQTTERQNGGNAPGPREVPDERPAAKEEERKRSPREEIRLQTIIGEQLKHAMDIVSDGALPVEGVKAPPLQTDAAPSGLEQQFKAVLNQALEEAANKLSSRLAPILTKYVEDYVKQMLLEVAEKVIREEIDKLLKESTA